MTKIFINPGHDIDLDSGAVNPNTGRRECDVARDAGKLLAWYLQTAGFMGAKRHRCNSRVS